MNKKSKIKHLINELLNTTIGYTLIKGDYRKSHIETISPILPPHLIENARILNTRYAIIDKLPLEKGAVICEVGVAAGHLTEKLLKILNPSKLIAIDNFKYSAEELSNSTSPPIPVENINMSHEMFFKNRFKKEIESGILEIKKGYSWNMLNEIDKKSIDFIYVDADHSYISVVKDINALKDKIKDDGIIQFNDYAHVIQ